MDNLTHSLFALTLANAGIRRAGRGATAALLIASNIPDIEILTAFTGGRVAYLSAHRGPTHGPGALALAVGTAVCVWLAQRFLGRYPDRARFRWLLAAAVIGVLGHIGMDFATSYGTRVLSPFTYEWFGVDWMPIIDIFLLLALAGGLVATKIRPEWRRRAAVIVLILAAGDYAARATLHGVAVTRALELTRALPGGVDAADRPATVFRYLGRSQPAALPAALPTEGSPFDWRLVVPTRSGYLVTQMNLLDRGGDWRQRAMARALAFPNDAGPFIERAAAARLGQVFLGFSRFPSAEILTHANGDLTVHWYDLRFAERRVPVGGDRRQHSSPFGAWVRLSPGGVVVGQGLGPG